MKKSTVELIARLTKLGLSESEIITLRRCEMTLQRWFEYECGTGDDRITRSIERDENGEGKPFMRVQYATSTGWHDSKYPIADREAGARKRIAKIMKAHSRRLVAYIQGDPRGCALYILRKGNDIKRGEDINSIYSRGFAVCD
jgi:hypothetical protein